MSAKIERKERRILRLPQRREQRAAGARRPELPPGRDPAAELEEERDGEDEVGPARVLQRLLRSSSLSNPLEIETPAPRPKSRIATTKHQK